MHTPFHTASHVRRPCSQHLLTLNTVESDILYFSETLPQINGVGCNQGKVDTYDTIDASTLSNGAYTAQQAAANPLCFATQFAKAELPGLTGLSAAALKPLNTVFNSVGSTLKCTAIGSVNTTALSACPGFTLYGGPKAKVAPGAIQS